MIYQPAEDSFLIAKQVEKFSKDKYVLDMGTGSGYLAKCAHNAKAKFVLGVDINKEAIDKLKSERNKKLRFIHSNLFDKVNGKFDLIIFNPPYLPEDRKEDNESKLVTTGGKKGDEIIIKFLKMAKNHLDNDGIILLLLSSLTPRNRIASTLKELNLKHTQLVSKHLFFEILEVVKIEKT